MRKNMGRPLSEIVNAALTEADSSMKLASAQDVAPSDPGDFLAAELPTITKVAEGGETCPECKNAKADCTCPKEGESKTSSDQSVLDAASYGMKLAAALDTVAMVVTDLTKVAMPGTASGTSPGPHTPTAAPGPAVMESGHINATTVHPKAQTNSVPANQASHGGGPITQSGGKPQGLETNEPDFRDPDWTKNKEAAEALIQAKVAQAEEYERHGQLDAAERALREANAVYEQLKVAADPSSPQAKLPAHNESFRLDTSPGPSTHIGDNASLISMTRASAKDRSQREAGEFMSENAKKDNAVQAHVGRTDGLKVSSLSVSSLFRPKIAEETNCPKCGKVECVCPAAKKDEEKKASLDDTQLEAARAYLKKIAAAASDPNATEEERTKAASLIDAVRTRAAEKNLTPEELLHA